MSDSSFPRTRKGGAAGASPRLAAADAILQRLRGEKKKPSPVSPCCQGSLLSQAGLFAVWVVILGEDFLAGVGPRGPSEL